MNCSLWEQNGSSSPHSFLSRDLSFLSGNFLCNACFSLASHIYLFFPKAEQEPGTEALVS